MCVLPSRMVTTQVVKAGAIRGHAVRDFPEPALRALLANPDGAFSWPDTRVLKDSRTSTVAAVVLYFVLRRFLVAPLAGVLAWDGFVLFFLLATYRVIVDRSIDSMRRRAAELDARTSVIMVLVVVAAFASLYGKRRVRAFTERLKDLQTELGELNDIATAGPLVESLPLAPDAALVAGEQLGERRAERKKRVRRAAVGQTVKSKCTKAWW